MSQSGQNTVESNFYRFMGKQPQMAATTGFNKTVATLPKQKPLKYYKPMQSNNIPRYNDWLGSTVGGQLIDTLKSENDVLKEEIESLRTYLKSAVVIYHQLEIDHKSVNKLLSQKDSDIQRILQTIILNETESETEFQHQLGICQQEIFVMTQHLSEAVTMNTQKENEKKDLKDQIDRAKQYNEQIQNNMNGAIQREQVLTNQIELTKLRNNELIKENEDLGLQVNPLKHEIVEIKSLMQQNIKNSDQIKQSLVDEKDEQRKLKIKLNQTLDHLKEAERGLEKKSDRDNYIKSIDTLEQKHLIQIKDLELQIYKFEIRQGELRSQIELLTSQKDKSMKTNIDLGVQLADEKDEQRKLKLKLNQTLDILKEAEKNLEKEMEGEKYLKSIEIIKQKHSKQIKEMDLQIFKFETQLEELRQQIELLTLEKEKLTKANMEQGIKLKDYQQSLRIIADLNIQIKDKTNQINQLQSNLEQNSTQQQLSVIEHQQAIIQLESDILRLEKQNDYLNQQLDYAQANQINYREVDLLKKQIQLLQLENNKITNLDDTIKKHFEEAETTIGSLKGKNKSLDDQNEQNQGKILQLTVENNQLKGENSSLRQDNKLLEVELQCLQKLLNQNATKQNFNQSTRPSSVQKSAQQVNDENPYLSPSYRTTSNFISPQVEKKKPEVIPNSKASITNTTSNPNMIATFENFGRPKQQQSSYQPQRQYNDNYQNDIMIIDYPVRGGNMKPVAVNYNSYR